MSEFEYVVASPADRADCIDFGNYVFSNAHCPHDFKTLLPKVYADGAIDHSTHFIAKKDGRIRAMVAMLPLNQRVFDHTLRMGFVGTVSVHPYARGEGHMKRLMKFMMDTAVERNYDLLVLGGQRQRYNYFGFEAAGTLMNFTVSKTNLRHCLGDADVSNITFSELTEEHPDEVDFACALAAKQPMFCDRPREEFLNIMHSWNSPCRLIRVDGAPVGYVMGSITEIALTDEALLPRVLKAFLHTFDVKEVRIAVAPHETARIRELSTICENMKITPHEMIKVLNWRNVLDALLAYKARTAPLTDGCVTLEVDGQRVTMKVENGVPSVTDGGEPDLVLEHLEAQRLLFGLQNALVPDPRFGNWLPLPYCMSNADTF